MKKLVLGLLVAALVALGLVGTGTAAQADAYTGTVAVSAAPAPVKAKAGKKAQIAIAAASGNVKPTGTAKVVCKVKGAKKVKKNAPLVDGVAKTGKLKKAGKWKCKVTYTPTANSVFKAASFTTKVKVKK